VLNLLSAFDQAKYCDCVSETTKANVIATVTGNARESERRSASHPQTAFRSDFDFDSSAPSHCPLS
jgi:hypothetical protein